jgi:hypothetical protein
MTGIFLLDSHFYDKAGAARVSPIAAIAAGTGSRKNRWLSRGLVVHERMFGPDRRKQQLFDRARGLAVFAASQARCPRQKCDGQPYTPLCGHRGRPVELSRDSPIPRFGQRAAASPLTKRCHPIADVTDALQRNEQRAIFFGVKTQQRRSLL